MAMQLLAGMVLSCIATACIAATFSASVIGVSDGDTLTVLRDGQQVRIRLSEIDTPEKNQPYGQRSKQSLSQLCLGVKAQVQVVGPAKKYSATDTPRQVARVECRGVDANAEQLRRGMAWVYDQYATDRTFDAHQSEARNAAIGLWADANSIAPWEWRKLKHSAPRKQ